jgi:hypothetical protein
MGLTLLNVKLLMVDFNINIHAYVTNLSPPPPGYQTPDGPTLQLKQCFVHFSQHIGTIWFWHAT